MTEEYLFNYFKNDKIYKIKEQKQCKKSIKYTLEGYYGETITKIVKNGQNYEYGTFFSESSDFDTLNGIRHNMILSALKKQADNFIKTVEDIDCSNISYAYYTSVDYFMKLYDIDDMPICELALKKLREKYFYSEGRGAKFALCQFHFFRIITNFQ